MYFFKSLEASYRSPKNRIAKRIAAYNPTSDEIAKLDATYSRSALSFRDVETIVDIIENHALSGEPEAISTVFGAHK